MTLTEKLQAALKQTLGPARRQLRLTQAYVADRAGISLGFYGKLERGTGGLPSLYVAVRLIAALGIQPGQLLGDAREIIDMVPVDKPEHSPRIQVIVRQLQTASPGALRLTHLLLSEMASVDGGQS